MICLCTASNESATAYVGSAEVELRNAIIYVHKSSLGTERPKIVLDRAPTVLDTGIEALLRRLDTISNLSHIIQEQIRPIHVVAAAPSVLYSIAYAGGPVSKGDRNSFNVLCMSGLKPVLQVSVHPQVFTLSLSKDHTVLSGPLFAQYCTQRVLMSFVRARCSSSGMVSIDWSSSVSSGS